MNVVRLMHMEVGLPNPTEGWELRMLLKGIQRKNGAPPKQKLPITLSVLRDLHKVIDVSSSFFIAFWAACIIGFYCFLRKSTLLPERITTRGYRCLCMGDVTIESAQQANIVVRHTKTIQFGQRVLKLPLIAIPDSALCPVHALNSLMVQFQDNDDTNNIPLFSYYDDSHQVRCLTYSSFVKTLRSVLKHSGYSPEEYSGHSFRRGGCSFAFKVGLPTQLIKLRGDWKSNAYERYVHVDDSIQVRVAKALSLAVQSS